jgi:rod shape-determining protein MreC
VSAEGPSRHTGRRFPVSSESVAEVVGLLMLIYMVAGPLSGLVLATYSAVTGVCTRGLSQVKSTGDAARQLLEASNRIKTLEKQLADADLSLTQLRQEAKDTASLRELLGLKQSLYRRTLAADVVSRNPDNWFERVTIDKGASAGVQTGSAVITPNGVIGQIVTVGPTSSVVRLLTDPDQGIGVLIPRISQMGVLKGRRKEPAVIEYVPIGAPVEVSDKVTCLSNGSIFPSGHPVGYVCGVRRDTNGTTVTIEVRPSESSLDLTHVLVVPPLQE